MDRLDLALLSDTKKQMQVKTASVAAAASASVRINVHKGKSNILNYNKENIISFTLNGETLEEVECFTYLNSIINERGGIDADVNTRIGKANAAFLQLKNIWNSTTIVNQHQSKNLQFEFQKNVRLYRDESCITTTIIVKQ
ncbi:unnamed protein product [Schistosoma margrebowiei]|uniref:Uncharacterized protein n=1 Tax=Schistosoma margrebowiei TaxID=48269 RepID=A0A183LUF0_9TREM|nr:unnamed protein product [Schistosoma margrebowiei]